MAVSIDKISAVFEEFSPLRFQCEWDNTGWNIFLNNDVSGIYVCLDVNRGVIENAVKNNCNVILSHHPLLFSAVRSIDENNAIGSLILELAKNNIALFCAHTSVDSAPWGINGYIADALNMKDKEYLMPVCDGEAGLGIVGDVSKCTLADIAGMVKEKLSIDVVRVSGSADAIIKRAAVCSGAAGDMVGLARQKGADVYITGEIKHNYYIENKDIALIEAGHYDTEKCFVGIAAEYLQKRFNELKYNVNVFLDDDTVCPYTNY